MNDFRDIFGVLTIVLSALGYIPVIAQTIKGKLKPHPVTWTVSTLTGGAKALILLFNKAGPGAWSPLFSTVCCLVLSIVAFFKYQKTLRITRRDILFLFLAISAVVLWLISRDLAIISVILLVASNIFGFVPTFTKTWKHPRSESLYGWTMSILGAVLGIMATVHLDFVNLFPKSVYTVLNCMMIFIIIFRRRKESN
ncbi:hypothetical protein FWC31_00590 [Candidatus Saccharibacteria bacterium]|nr:hypothetical protein [Candidatus Saccharibacteria bacterium]